MYKSKINDSKIFPSGGMTSETLATDSELEETELSSNFGQVRINTSTPIEQIDLHGTAFTNEVFEFMELVVLELNGIKETVQTIDNSLLSKKITKMEESLGSFFSLVKELISKCSENYQCDRVKDDYGNFLQEVHTLKSNLAIQEKMNCSLDHKNEQLEQEVRKVLKDNKDLLNKYKALDLRLFNTLQEIEDMRSTQQNQKEHQDSFITNNNNLMKEEDWLKDSLECRKTPIKKKNIAMQTEDISKSRKVTQLYNGYHKVVELEQKIDKVLRGVSELLSQNSILLGDREELRPECKQVKDTVEISSFCSEENLYNELAFAEQKGKLDKSNQTEVYFRSGPENMVSTKNGYLVDVTQGCNKKADSPTKLTEQFKVVKSQCSTTRAYSRKHITYTSVSLVLFGMFAVGASLTISHLAICTSLAVAALVSLVVGCYCLYKTNTALSNVEVGQIEKGVNPTNQGSLS